jgi:hypothetical protein
MNGTSNIKGDLTWGVIPAEDKPHDKRMDKLEAKFLPKLPGTFYVLGSCGSGKSSILWTLLTEGYMYRKGKGGLKSIFDECIIYLGTLDAKDAFEKLPIENTLILEEFDPESFDEYMTDLKQHQMEKLAKKKPLLNTLLIFDDFVGVNLMKKPKPNMAPPIEKLALTSRHEANCSIFFCSQVYKNTGFSRPSIRNNITTYIISQMSRGELAKIAEEMADEYEPDEWLYHYDVIMAKRPYNFVTYDRRRSKGMKWLERFSEPFPPPQRMNNIKKKMGVRLDEDLSSSDEE